MKNKILYLFLLSQLIIGTSYIGQQKQATQPHILEQLRKLYDIYKDIDDFFDSVSLLQEIYGSYMLGEIPNIDSIEDEQFVEMIENTRKKIERIEIIQFPDIPYPQTDGNFNSRRNKLNIYVNQLAVYNIEYKQYKELNEGLDNARKQLLLQIKVFQTFSGYFSKILARVDVIPNINVLVLGMYNKCTYTYPEMIQKSIEILDNKQVLLREQITIRQTSLSLYLGLLQSSLNDEKNDINQRSVEMKKNYKKLNEEAKYLEKDLLRIKDLEADINIKNQLIVKKQSDIENFRYRISIYSDDLRVNENKLRYLKSDSYFNEYKYCTSDNKTKFIDCIHTDLKNQFIKERDDLVKVRTSEISRLNQLILRTRSNIEIEIKIKAEMELDVGKLIKKLDADRQKYDTAYSNLKNRLDKFLKDIWNRLLTSYESANARDLELIQYHLNIIQ